VIGRYDLASGGMSCQFAECQIAKCVRLRAPQLASRGWADLSMVTLLLRVKIRVEVLVGAMVIVLGTGCG